MSERTTIGGTVYEAIGSSSSNLLLKCNGTARIQWGGKLIDLIKNGKIASADSQELVFIITDESEIKSDGIYILTTNESNKLLISKDGTKYDITNTDLYISASKPQELTVDQKKQALDNIGMYYTTFDELKNSGIKNGIAYVIETKTLYTIKDSVIEEFEAKLKTVTVDNTEVEGDVINSKVKLVLAVQDDEYLILADQRITANYSIHVKNSAQLGSEGADKSQGYRLYIDGETSWLDVDEINVRNGINVTQYKEITFAELSTLITSSNLIPLNWYLITDFQNHWKVAGNKDSNNRPILVRALTESSLYEDGFLFKNHKIRIKYDISFQDEITIQKEDGSELKNKARGKITWMKDLRNNNEANFDFLDYFDHEGKELATLHYPFGSELDDKSIFPKHSHDNILIAYDLKGITINSGKLENTNVTTIDFQFDDSTESSMIMYNNYIECRGLVLTSTCNKFYNNNLKQSIKLKIGNDFISNTFNYIYSKTDQSVNSENFLEITDNTVFSEVVFNNKVENNSCKEIRNCIFQNEFKNCVFGLIELCTFNDVLDKAILTSVTQSNCVFSKITNSAIKEIINGVTITSEIKNTTIDLIKNSVTINAVIEDCYINSILTNTTITETIKNSNFKSIDNSIISSTVNNSIFENVVNSTINNSINDSKFKNITNSALNSYFESSVFLNIIESTFGEGSINNVESFYDINENVDNSTQVLLYDSTKRKEIYLKSGKLWVITIPEAIFHRGMIIMHSGIEPVPDGWAPCDGNEYEWNGIKSITPDLKNRFIKAVTPDDTLGPVDNDLLNDKGEFTLTTDYLPKHQHPHKEHTHTISDISVSIGDSGTLSVSGTGYSYDHVMTAVQSVSVPEDSEIELELDVETGNSGEYYRTDTFTYTGGNHSHVATVSGGSISGTTSEEQNWQYKEEPLALKFIPNYYSLIFIMKL